MTTYFQFQPSQQNAFQFQPNLDGNPYTAVVSWNLFGQRFYLNLYDASGNRIFTRALVESPPGVSIQSMTWDTGIVEVETVASHGLQVGTIVPVTITGVTPAGYNGNVQVYVNGPTSFQYNLATNPGAVSAQGQVSYSVNMVSGYFKASIVFRDQQFAVSP